MKYTTEHNLLPITARVILQEAAATRDGEARVIEIDKAISIVRSKWPERFRLDADELL